MAANPFTYGDGRAALISVAHLLTAYRSLVGKLIEEVADTRTAGDDRGRNWTARRQLADERQWAAEVTGIVRFTESELALMAEAVEQLPLAYSDEGYEPASWPEVDDDDSGPCGDDTDWAEDDDQLNRWMAENGMPDHSEMGR